MTRAGRPCRAMERSALHLALRRRAGRAASAAAAASAASGGIVRIHAADGGAARQTRSAGARAALAARRAVAVVADQAVAVCVGVARAVDHAHARSRRALLAGAAVGIVV